MRLNGRTRNGGGVPGMPARGRWFVLPAAVAIAGVAASCSLTGSRRGRAAGATGRAGAAGGSLGGPRLRDLQHARGSRARL